MIRMRAMCVLCLSARDVTGRVSEVLRLVASWCEAAVRLPHLLSRLVGELPFSDFRLLVVSLLDLFCSCPVPSFYFREIERELRDLGDFL